MWGERGCRGEGTHEQRHTIHVASAGQAPARKLLVNYSACAIDRDMAGKNGEDITVGRTVALFSLPCG